MDRSMCCREALMYTYENLQADIRLLETWYPGLIWCESLADTPDRRKVYHLVIGAGGNRVHNRKKIFFNAGIHAREYITSQLVMKQAAAFLEHVWNGEFYAEQSYRHFLENTVIHVVPMVNPDGVSISQRGEKGIRTGKIREKVENIAQLDGENFSGEYLIHWKANANGVDLNRNFDALWEEYSGPAKHPSSEHYKGRSPGCEPESAALIRLTRREKFARTISYHTQGSVIYWYFAQRGKLYWDTLDFGERISGITGYPLDSDYENLDPAGYKDWAISKLGIPSLTIEVGSETSPVPPEQFSEIWKRNRFVWEETILSLGR